MVFYQHGGLPVGLFIKMLKPAWASITLVRYRVHAFAHRPHRRRLAHHYRSCQRASIRPRLAMQRGYFGAYCHR